MVMRNLVKPAYLVLVESGMGVGVRETTLQRAGIPAGD